MTSEMSKFHFSYIRDFDRFKANFNEKGWSKKTKKSEKKDEPGFPSYYVIHRYEYKGEDGHTKGRLLVSDLPPDEHKKREERRKKKFERWKKEQQLIKHQEKNDNGEKETNYPEKARHEEVNSRKESVAVTSMNREQDDARTSEIELGQKARKYVEEIINRSIVLLQCDVKGNRNPKLAEPAAEAREHVSSAEQQEEKTKIASLQDNLENAQGEVEHVKCEENPELRDMVRNYVNEIIDNCLVLLQFNEIKIEHPMSTANLSDAITPEQNSKDKEDSDNVPTPRENTKLEADLDKGKSSTTELGLRDMVRGYVNDIIDKSLASLRCNEEEGSMVPGKTPERNVNEKTIRDILRTEESRERESEHDTCKNKPAERDLQDTAKRLVDEIINTSLALLECEYQTAQKPCEDQVVQKSCEDQVVQQPKSLVLLSQSKVRENKEKAKTENIHYPQKCTEQNVKNGQWEKNFTEKHHSNIARRILDEMIRNSLGSKKYEEQELEEMAKIDGSEDLLRSTEQEVKQPQPGTEIKYTPQDCEDASLLLLLVHNTTAIPTPFSPELLDMDDYRKERRQQFDEKMTRDVSTVLNIGVYNASTVDATSLYDSASSREFTSTNLDVNDTNMELNCSHDTFTKGKKDSKMRRMLRRVRKGIRCLCCCFKQ